MGTITLPGAPAPLADALFTPVQKRVLAVLFGQPFRRFQSADLIRRVRSGTGATHRLLERLAKTGLVRTSMEGRQKYYQANHDSPIFEELRGLIRKTVGLVDPLADTLAPLASEISGAFVYGSVASGEDRADSDIDLMILTDTLDYPTVFEALGPAEQALGRPINPTVMSPSDWQKQQKAPESFVSRIRERPRLFVIGSEDGIG